MSTVLSDSDLRCLPSCSFETFDKPQKLCDDVLRNVYRQLCKVAPAAEAMKFKAINSLAREEISKTLSENCELSIEVFEPIEYRIIGLKKERLSTPDPVIFVQGTRVNISHARKLLRCLIKQMRALRKLCITIEDRDLTHLNALLDEVLAADNVALEVLQVRRRKGGQMIPKVSDLIRQNASTLRILGRIGLSEAANGFNETINLDRLSVMTFDLGLDASQSRICDELLSITQSGAKFKHMSYTSFVGFDPTDELIQNFLDSCEVSSLRLTMMKGPCVPTQPDYMIGKVRKVTKLELGEVVERPNIFNSLISCENIFKKVFPNLTDNVHFFQQW